MNRLSMRAALAGFAALAFCVAPAPTHAQIGGLIRKAAGKVVDEKVQEKADEIVPPKPLEGTPITAATLDGLLGGLKFELAQQTEATRLKKIQESKHDAWAKAFEAGHDEADRYRAANDKLMECVSDRLNEIEQEEAQQMTARMLGTVSGPGAQERIQQIMQYSQRISEAQAKGDTAALRRAMTQYMKTLGVDLAADSAKAYATCGKPPAPPAAYVRIEKTADELRDANEALRKVESDLVGRAAEVAGMDPKDYFLARERLWVWQHAREAKRKVGVTKDEEALLDSRAKDIDRVKAALR